MDGFGYDQPVFPCHVQLFLFMKRCHPYGALLCIWKPISIQDYLDNERLHDAQNQETALFLPASSAVNGKDTLSVRSINLIWEDVRNMANVDADKTPHSARHAMGKHIMEKTGNISAVQRQLGHRNAIYSMQYARISADELQNVLDERE